MNKLEHYYNIFLDIIITRMFRLVVSFVITSISASVMINSVPLTISIISSLLIGTFVYLIFIVLAKRDYPINKWDYEIIENTFTLTINNKKEAEYTQSYYIVVKEQSDFVVHEEFDWGNASVDNLLVTTGSDKYDIVYSYKETVNDIETIYKNSAKNGDVLPNVSNMKLDIKYSEALHEGDKKNISISLLLKNMRCDKDELYAIINRPVKKLIIILKIKNGINISDVMVEGLTTKGHIFSIAKKKPLNYRTDINFKEYKVEINKPKLFCKYIVSWNYYN